MRKPGFAILAVAVALLLLAVILFLSPGVGPGALDSEKTFLAGLWNSLYYLDQAKSQWAEEKHKSERDVPTMAELTPYLGRWTNRIERFIALGITYRITPISDTESQSDIATLTRDLRFRSGICRFYPAGTHISLRAGWAHPDSGGSSLRAFYFNHRELFAAALFISGIGILLVFAVRKIRSSRQVSSVTHEHQNI
jgi:hypothetical protein